MYTGRVSHNGQPVADLPVVKGGGSFRGGGGDKIDFED